MRFAFFIGGNNFQVFGEGNERCQHQCHSAGTKIFSCNCVFILAYMYSCIYTCVFVFLYFISFCYNLRILAKGNEGRQHQCHSVCTKIFSCNCLFILAYLYFISCCYNLRIWRRKMRDVNSSGHDNFHHDMIM